MKLKYMLLAYSSSNFSKSTHKNINDSILSANSTLVYIKSYNLISRFDSKREIANVQVKEKISLEKISRYFRDDKSDVSALSNQICLGNEIYTKFLN